MSALVLLQQRLGDGMAAVGLRPRALDHDEDEPVVGHVLIPGGDPGNLFSLVVALERRARERMPGDAAEILRPGVCGDCAVPEVTTCLREFVRMDTVSACIAPAMYTSRAAS